MNTPPNLGSAVDTGNRWAYPSLDKRDLRIDFMRGLIMIYLVVVHIEYFSLFSLFAWEHFAIISSAEGFVMLSGIVVGMVYGKRSRVEGLLPAAKKLWQRAFKLYRVNVFVILSIALLSLLPFINMFDVTHWWVPGERLQAYRLYPPETAPWWEWLWKALTLQSGPHQFQILGLYVVLLSLAPLVIMALMRGYVGWVLLASWALYIANLFLKIRITPAMFELGFPLLTWQLLFFNGLVVGFYHDRVFGWLVADANRWAGRLAAVLSMAFMFLALNAPSLLFWPWDLFPFLSPETFQNIHNLLFDKTRLGLGRILNNVSLFIIMYVLLTRYWLGFNKVLGWLLIPLGQASLYVFTLHVYAILLVSNLPDTSLDSFVWVTLAHGAVILGIWLMVKHRVLFRWIPR